MRLVICTRADPLLPLPRWRAHGGSSRCTLPTCASQPRRRLSSSTSAWHSTCSLRTSSSWSIAPEISSQAPAGCPFAPASRRCTHGRTHLGASRHYMLDYLLEEVLARQPAAIQRFLLQTSILARMCGPLCDAVTRARRCGHPAGSATPEPVCRAAGRRPLVVSLSPLVCRAAACSARPGESRCCRPPSPTAPHNGAEQGAAVNTVQHALTAQALEHAAHLLEAHEHDWWTGSDLSMMNLLPHLPDEVVVRGPILSVYKAWFLLINGQLQSASTLLATVKESLAAAQDRAEHQDLLSFVAVQQAYIAELTGSPRPQPIDPAALSHISKIAAVCATVPRCS